MNRIEKEKLIKADIASIENRVRHAFNQGYDLGYKEGKANCSEIPTGSTTKNDLGNKCIDRWDINDKEAEAWMVNGRLQIRNRGTIHNIDLSSVTPQPCEDAISRKKVLNQIFYSTDNSGDVVLGSELRSRIERLPSVTPQEPKTGKWISTETKGVRYAFWCRYKCSLCGGLSAHTNFCPNCGAKMESEDKE